MSNNIENYLQGLEEYNSYLELSYKYDLDDIVEAIGLEEFMELSKTTQSLDDQSKSIMWAAMDKALNSDRPKPYYNGLIKEEKEHNSIHEVVANYYDLLEYKSNYLPEFKEQFKNIKRSPIVKGVFYIINEVYKERLLLLDYYGVNANELNEEGLVEEIREDSMDGEDGNGFYTYFIDILNEVFPHSYDSRIANRLYDQMLNDDNNFDKDTELTYFYNTLTEHEDVDMTYVIRDNLKDYFKKVLK